MPIKAAMSAKEPDSLLKSGWSPKQKSPEDYAKHRVEKYDQYIQSNVLLPMPEVTKARELRTLSFVAVDLKTRRLASLKKDTFEELMKTSGVPCQYFYHRSYATRNILLPIEKVAAKLASENIITKNYRLQPEYMGMRRTKVVIHNGPVDLAGDYFAFFLSTYDQVEEVIPLRDGTGMANGDYTFILCLKRERFQRIPDTIQFRNQKLSIIVEGRRPHYWPCRQPRHLAMEWPVKADGNKAPEQPTPPENTSNSAEGWTKVVRKARKAPPPAKSASHSEGKTEENPKKKPVNKPTKKKQKTGN